MTLANNNASRKTLYETLLKILAVLAALLFVFKVTEYALTMTPNLDEGAYLFQGLSYARGEFRFLQPYGFFTGKIYLSYFIWGWIQLIFGVGLTAPRLVTIVLNIFSLLGITLMLRKHTPTWAVTLALWIIAINFPLLKMLSLANSQVIIFFMVIWVCYFLISFERKTLGMVLGSIILALMMLTRENMIFFAPACLLYIFFERGKKSGLISLSLFLVIFMVGNSIYYPEIMKLWDLFLPRLKDSIANLTPDAVVPASRYHISTSTKIQSVVNGIRLFSIEFFGISAAVIYFLRHFSIKFYLTRKKLIFLLCSFVILFIPHTLASVGLNYCTYCFSSYTVFYIPLAFLIPFILFTEPEIFKEDKFFKTANGLIFFIFIIILWVSFSEYTGKIILNVPFGLVNPFQPQSEIHTLGAVLINKFGLSIQVTRQVISLFFGILTVGVLTAAFFALEKIFPGKIFSLKTTALFSIFLLAFFVIRLGANELDGRQCQVNTLRWYEKVGAKVKQIVPANSTVFIGGPISSLPLLYLDQIKYFPPQINGSYSFSDRAESNDEILKKGRWNEYFQYKWLDEATVLILDKKSKETYEDKIDTTDYTLNSFQLSQQECVSNIEYYVYVKK